MSSHTDSARMGKQRGKVDTKSNKNHTEQTQDQLDPELQHKVQQVMDATQCTQTNAVFALHDTDNDVNAAVNMLFDSDNNVQSGWQEQGKKRRKPVQTEEPEPETDDNAQGDWVEPVNNSNNKQTYVARNAPPRMRNNQLNKRPEYRSRDNGAADGDYGGRRGGGSARGGRGRDRGGRGRGGFNRGGFSNRPQRTEPESGAPDRPEDSGPSIGTWSNDTAVTPSRDSWGETWDEDNQWQGNLKETHVFEASKPEDTFPTPTDFDPSAIAAQKPVVENDDTAGQRLGGDTSFPKAPVTQVAPEAQQQQPSTQIYENQRAAESIKNAIGLVTQPSDTDPIKPALQQSRPSATQPIRQQKSKLPPPSTKIPTAPVEMPHSSNKSMMDQLGVQFGNMDFSAEAGLSFEGSLGDSYNLGTIGSTDSAAAVTAGSGQTNQAQTNNMYNSPNKQASGPEPIPYPSSVQASASPQQNQRNQNTYNSQPKSSASSFASYNSSTTSSPSYKASNGQHTPSQSAQNQSSSGSQSFHNSRSNSQQQQQQSSSGMYGAYHQQQGSAVSEAETGSSNSNFQNSSSQFQGSMYPGGDSSFNQYDSRMTASLSTATSTTSSSLATGSASNTTSMSSSTQQNQPSVSSTRASGTSKAPPNLPPPAAAATAAATATPLVGMPNSYFVGGHGLPAYYQNAPNMYSMDDMQKFQQQLGYYTDMSQFSMPASSIGTSVPGFTGTSDGKMTRMDAQSPTVQGSTQPGAQQGQQTAASQQQAHQQFVAPSLPPGYGYYYPNPNQGVMAAPYGMFQMPSVTQNMTVPGSNSSGTAFQKPAAGSSYGSYGANAGYDDLAPHADYNKGMYGGSSQGLGKQSNNMGNSGSGAGSELSSMYKSSIQSNTQPGTNAYNTGNYMHSGHMLPHQQPLMPSQLADSGVGVRNSQPASGKSHSGNKGGNYYGGWGN